MVLAMAGTGIFVVLASAGVTPTATLMTSSGVLTALGVVVAIVAGLEVIARRASKPVRCLAYAGISAVSYGFGSALIRVISRTLAAGADGLLSPLMLTAALAVVGAMAAGAWAVQQAYAAGPPRDQCPHHRRPTHRDPAQRGAARRRTAPQPGHARGDGRLPRRCRNRRPAARQSPTRRHTRSTPIDQTSRRPSAADADPRPHPHHEQGH